MIDIGDGIPSQYCIDVNAHALARYAALCQDEGIVPIVEPEVLMDGDHSIDRCYEVTTQTLHTVFDQLAAQRCELEGLLLKPNMVIPGKKYSGGKADAGAGRRRDDPLLPAHGARGGARHRVPVGWPERRGSDREPRRDQQEGPATLAGVVLVRPRAAGRRRSPRGRARTPTPAPARRRTCTAPG